MTTARFFVWAISIILFVSSIVRHPMTLGRFEPGIGNTKAFDPVAKIQMSYSTSIPLEVVTILFSLSTFSTGSLFISSILFS